MSMCRRLYGETVRRLIVSVPVVTVDQIDALLAGAGYGRRHPAQGCRSEFIRIAIMEKLARDRKLLDDLYRQYAHAREG